MGKVTNYADPLATYLHLTGQADAEGNLLTSNPETSGRYHSAWLSMMYPRLFLARQLLREDGVIFVSIDDHEVHNLRLLMNEVFGEENFIAAIIWQKIFAPKNTAMYFSEDHDYVLAYAQNADIWRPFLLPRTEEADARYENSDNDPRGPWTSSDLTVSLTSGQRGRQYQRTGHTENAYEVLSPAGIAFAPPSGRCWGVSKDRFEGLDRNSRVWWGPDGTSMPRLKRFLSEVKQGIVPQTLFKYQDVGHTQEASQELKALFPEAGGTAFPTPKPTRLMKRLLQIATTLRKDDLVLDFFAGSCSLAHAVLETNKDESRTLRFIMVQLPEPLTIPLILPAGQPLSTIADIGKERIRRVIARMNEAKAGQLPLDTRDTPEDLGFRVFKLAPSHFQPWSGAAESEPAAYAHQMALFTDPLAPGWTPEAVIYEIALKEGYSLNCHIATVGAHGRAPNTLFRVTDPDRDQSFTICLDLTLHPETVRALQLTPDDLFICRDVALTDDLAANLALQCRLKTI